MITCPNCHQQLADDAKFCGNCATPLTQGAVELNKSQDEDPFVGKCIDNKYLIVKRIAQGGMGVVYLAKQKGVGQEVAIKKLHPELYGDRKIVERFIDEARSYGRISHPNAVKLHDLLNVNDQICLVMEFVHGQTLTHYIESGYVFTIRQIIDICMQLADALATVHQAGIIHRDLKAENVMLQETVSGRFSVKILDFGIAKMMDKPNNHNTKDGVLVGTPEFMSPEQCFGKQVDNRSDIYAFGILMYLMICGKLPYICTSTLAMLQKQINEPTPPIVRADNSEVSPELAAIVKQCMEKSPDDRYQSFADVISDLMCLQEGRSISIAIPAASLEQAAKSSPEVVESAKMDEISDESKQANEKTPDRPKHSLVLGIDISGEKGDGDIMALSMGDDEFGLDENDGKNELDNNNDDDKVFSEDDGYSLGDLEALSEIPDSMAVSDAHRGHGRVVGVILILLLIAGGIYLFKAGVLSSTPEKKVAQVDMPTAFKSSAEPIPVEDSPADVVPQAAAAPETAAAPEPKIIEQKAVPASEIASRDVIQRGVLRAALTQSKTYVDAGELEKTASILEYITPRKAGLEPADAEKLSVVTARNDQFKEIMAKSKQAMGDYNCSSIRKMVDLVPEESIGMRNLISKRAANCDHSASRTPDKL